MKEKQWGPNMEWEYAIPITQWGKGFNPSIIVLFQIGRHQTDKLVYF